MNNYYINKDNADHVKYEEVRLEHAHTSDSPYMLSVPAWNSQLEKHLLLSTRCGF